MSYVDGQPEDATYLKREGQVKIAYPNGDTFEGTVGSGLVKQGEGTYSWCQRSEDGDGRPVDPGGQAFFFYTVDKGCAAI